MFINCNKYDCINNDDARCTLGDSRWYPLEIYDGECCCYEKKESDKKLIDNPCYHCYRGAIDECIGCKHEYEPWHGDLDADKIEVNSGGDLQ